MCSFAGAEERKVRLRDQDMIQAEEPAGLPGFQLHVPACAPQHHLQSTQTSADLNVKQLGACVGGCFRPGFRLWRLATKPSICEELRSNVKPAII